MESSKLRLRQRLVKLLHLRFKRKVRFREIFRYYPWNLSEAEFSKLKVLWRLVKLLYSGLEKM